MNNDFANDQLNDNQFNSDNQFGIDGQINDSQNVQPDGGSYHVTTNWNTAIENPEYDVNNPMGMNINNAGMDYGYPTGDNMDNNQFIPDTSVNYNYSDEQVDSSNNNSSVYEPVMEQNKNSNGKITIPREFKIALFIIFILLIFIALMPYIYDFFKDLELIITS